MLRKDKEEVINLLKKYFDNDKICVKIEDINLEEIPEHYKNWGISKHTERGVDISISFPCKGESNEEEESIQNIFTWTQKKYLEE